ncbi:GTPase HflX, partial [bacterium]|nr:GTPase HflX [bacterium]
MHSSEETDREVACSLEEMTRLIETLGGVVVDTLVQKRQKPDPAMYIGKGKAAEVARLVVQHGASLVAFDGELSGGQQRNLEKAANCRVIDRTGVILDIFHNHARTKEAKNQVELASLEYLATHLTRRWTHLERQKGGIGMRGAGEKQIELDRRMIDKSIKSTRERLVKVKKQRQTQRRQRERRDAFNI